MTESRPRVVCHLAPAAPLCPRSPPPSQQRGGRGSGGGGIRASITMAWIICDERVPFDE